MITASSFVMVVVAAVLLDGAKYCADAKENDIKVSPIANNFLNHSMTFKSRRLMYFDQESIEEFHRDSTVAIYHKSGEVTRCCLQIEWKTISRFHKLIIIVYDGLAVEALSGTGAVARHASSPQAAKEAAIVRLMNYMSSIGSVKSCLVNAYSYPLVSDSGNCRSGSSVTCGYSCGFRCDGPNYILIGKATLTCCANGHFNLPDFPSCQVLNRVTNASAPMTDTRRPSTVTLDSSSLSSSTTPHKINKTFTKVSTTDPNGGDSFSSRNEYDAKTTARSMHSVSTTDRNVGVSSSPTNTYGAKTSAGLVHSGVRTVRRSIAYVVIPAVFVVLLPALLVLRRRRRRSSQNYALLGDDAVLDEDMSPNCDGLYIHLHMRTAVPTDAQLNYNECYRMDSRRKGYAFILNNTRFPQGPRRGSEIDVTNVTHVFKEIGYEPILVEDLTAEQINASLDSLIRNIKECDTSVVLILMSHGVEDGIFGIDGNVVGVEEIKAKLSAQNCRALTDKPKIIIVQSCRGNNFTPSASDHFPQQGQMIASSVDIDTENPSSRVIDMNILDDTQMTLAASETDSPLPVNADFYIAYATSQGYLAVRSPATGSWFIDVLCQELLRRAHKDDLDTIMTEVTKGVTSLRESCRAPNGQYTRTQQTPQITKQGIRKRLYFLPKYPSTSVTQTLNP